MHVNNTLTLNDSAKQAINAQLLEGETFAPEDVVEAGLSILRERQMKVAALNEAIRKGEESGYTQFNFEDFKKKMHVKYSTRDA